MEIRRLTEAQLVIGAGYGNPWLSRINSPGRVRERGNLEKVMGAVLDVAAAFTECSLGELIWGVEADQW